MDLVGYFAKMQTGHMIFQILFILRDLNLIDQFGVYCACVHRGWGF